MDKVIRWHDYGDIKPTPRAPRKSIQQSWDIVGGLSKPSKMPSYGYSIPAKYCNVGSKLLLVEGSTCSKCYALKGRYVFPNVADCLERRYQSLNNPLWVDAMVHIINTLQLAFFRWHDAGDIQSIEHLHKIATVALLTPNTKHWLPTREYRIVKDYQSKTYIIEGQRHIPSVNTIPDNLTIRLSAHMVDTTPSSSFNLPTSTVIKNTTPNTFICNAKTRQGKCGPCRACWSPKVANVAYPIH